MQIIVTKNWVNNAAEMKQRVQKRRVTVFYQLCYNFSRVVSCNRDCTEGSFVKREIKQGGVGK